MDGTLVWESRLPGFVGYLAVAPQGRFSVRFSQHTTRSVVPFGQYVLVQVQDRSARRTGARSVQTEYGKLRTFVLARDDGKVVGVTEKMPLLRYTGAGRLVG
jgi:hypothetical protein